MKITRDFINEKMSRCTICPRRCGTDRQSGRKGFCGVPSQLYAARAALHFWEEPCISGRNGSGTVFFSGCNLRCVYCQNREVAAAHAGMPITLDRLIEIFFELEAQNANNINLVTPTPYFPQIAFAAAEAKKQGLKIPFICNCGGYEDPETLRLLDGIIDIYLTDFKYMDQAPAMRYSSAGDYSFLGEACFERDGSPVSGAGVRSGSRKYIRKNHEEGSHCTASAASRSGEECGADRLLCLQYLWRFGILKSDESVYAVR